MAEVIRFPDKRSFERIYSEFYDKVLAFVSARVDNHTIAEELTSDIFLKIYKNYHRFDPQKAKLSTWIFTITKNTLKNYYRDKKSIVSLETVENYNPTYDDDIEETLHLEYVKKVLDKAIGKLDPQKQAIIKMRFYDEMKFEDIAKELNMSPVNVRVTLNRLLSKLRTELEGEEL